MGDLQILQSSHELMLAPILLRSGQHTKREPMM